MVNAFIAWGVVCVFLLVAGSILSALTLREARSGGRDVVGSPALRRAYAAVILASCLFYYVSLPLVVLSVIGLGGGIIYGFFAIGRIPIKLVIVVAVVTGVTVWSMLKSLFVRVKDYDPGTKLDFKDAPRLRALLDEVAGKVGTRAVDNVYLTPGTDLAVMERGSFGAKLRGSTERCLILGVGVLDGMSQGEMKSVLAHEYGHFSNRDTAGGGLALNVRNSLITMAQGLAHNGAATWYNPAWWFFNGFYRVFLRTSQGATRLQEVMADRWAATCYGSETFVRGFTHAIRQSIRFDMHASATLNEVITEKSSLANLYAFTPRETASADDIEAAMREAFNREPSPYDSHPAPRDRVAWVQRMAVPKTTTAADEAPAWSLFADRALMEQRMTDEIRGNVAASHGIAIKAA